MLYFRLMKNCFSLHKQMHKAVMGLRIGFLSRARRKVSQLMWRLKSFICVWSISVSLEVGFI